MGAGEDDVAKERVPVRLTECMLEDLREKYPTMANDQARIVTALALHLSKDDPATPGDVNHEVRHCFKDLMGDIYPQDVMERIDELEEKIEEMDD